MSCGAAAGIIGNFLAEIIPSSQPAAGVRLARHRDLGPFSRPLIPVTGMISSQSRMVWTKPDNPPAGLEV